MVERPSTGDLTRHSAAEQVTYASRVVNICMYVCMYVWCVQEEEEIAAAIPTMDKRFRVT